MNRRSASRLATLATLSALLAAAIAGPAGVQARDAERAAGDRELRTTDPARETDSRREPRRIDVATLPDSAQDRPVYEPGLVRPESFAGPEPSDIQGGGPPAPTQTTSSENPVVDQATAFAGLAFGDRPETTLEPPDPWVAVGPEHVIQAVNTTFRISDRSGNTLETVDMFDFFGLSLIPNYEAYVFDPRVIYDSLHGRWIAIEASFDCYASSQATFGTGYLDVAISDSADPTAGWGILSIPYPDAIPDYPAIGTSTDKVVLSSNVFALQSDGGGGCGGGSFVGSEMDVMAWSELTGNDDIYIAYLYSPVSFPNNFFSWRPALQTPASSATVFAIAERADEGVAYARITGTPANAGAVSIAISNLTGAGVASPFAQPPQPNQPGSPATIADAVDGRPTDAVWKDNELAFVSTYPCDPAGGAVETRDCVRVTELSTATPASPTLIQDFLVAQSAADLYMGGIGYALNGDLHVVWTRSSESAGSYPSAYAAYQLVDDGLNSISARAVISAGTGTYPGDRWGDYVGVAQDPQVPNAVWQGNEYSVGASWWATEITQLQTGGTGFLPIEERVLDTRPAFQTGLSGVFAANTPRTFQVAGVGSIPDDAIAVTGNLTVVNQTAAGYVSVTPTPVANPLSSTINFPLGDTRANNLTIPLSATGTLSAVYKAPAGRTTHLVLDITGYYVAPIPSETATYSTMTPVRVLDSRPAYQIGLSSALVANDPETISIAGTLGIPADAIAITGNLTVVGQTRAGYLSLTQFPAVNPTTSTLNFPLGDTRANGVTVPLDKSGDVSIVYKASGGTTHAILDVTGYYRYATDGLLFYPLTPGRLMDTRPIGVLSGLSGPFSANTPRTLQTDGHWGVPIGANAITGNLTVVGQTAAGYVSITPTQEVNPTTSTLNFPLGDVRANGVTVPLNGSGNIALVYKASGGKVTHLILDLSGYFD